MSDFLGYAGRQAVVTGCSSGIGEATALALGSLGADVVGVDVKPPAVSVSAFVPCDLADPDAVDRAAQEIQAPVDALFNCAGLSDGAADPPTVFRVNFLGLRRLTESLVPKMPSGGAVVSVSSLGGLGWEANRAALADLLQLESWTEALGWMAAHPEQVSGGSYGLTKQAIILYTKQRCVEWAARGVRINVVAPSPVDTPMLADTVKVMGADFLERFPRPLGRNSTAEEQANVLLFLNSHAASYVTGQVLWTDGGYTAGVLTGALPSFVGRAGSEVR